MDPNTSPSLSERLGDSLSPFREAFAAFSRSLRVALPARVTKFNAQTQTLEAQPLLTEITRINGIPTVKALPLLVDVPILLPRGGGFSLTFPITPGDECLIVFTDTAFDAWFEKGNVQNQVSRRRHSLSDGFALVGIWSPQRVLPNYSTGSVMLRSDDNQTSIEVGPGTINLQAETISVYAYGTTTVHGGDQVNVTGSQVNVTGSSAVHISGNGQTFLEGRNFLSHTHTGVAGGGSVSGPVA